MYLLDQAGLLDIIIEQQKCFTDKPLILNRKG